MLEPINREMSLSEHAYDRLSRALMTGSFKPNEKVTVRDVAKALDVSITPAREALARLISEGALEAKSPKTVIVPPLTEEVLQEITKIRLSLEGLAAQAATPCFDKSGIKKLEKIQAALNSAMDRKDYPEVLANNELFHLLIYQTAGMPRLMTIIESLWLRIGPSLNLLYPDFYEHRQGISNHIDAIEGIRRGEPDVVRAAIEKDIRDGFVTLSRLTQAESK